MELSLVLLSILFATIVTFTSIFIINRLIHRTLTDEDMINQLTLKELSNITPFILPKVFIYITLHVACGSTCKKVTISEVESLILSKRSTDNESVNTHL